MVDQTRKATRNSSRANGALTPDATAKGHIRGLIKRVLFDTPLVIFLVADI
jgi:hypothetical protein